MINSNPETVSTDFDASSRLYFEPLDPESVRSVIDAESPPGTDLLPAVVAFGGQTPLNLAAPLAAGGVPLLGSDLEAIDQAEERVRFAALLDRLGIPQPEGGMAHSVEEALTLAERIGYPVIVRPSFVIGGLAIDFCYSPEDLERQLAAATVVDPDRPGPHRPLPRGRRGRRRCGQRRRAGADPGPPRARRAGRRPQRRQRRRLPAAVRQRGRPGPHRRDDGADRAGARREGPRQRPVHRPRRRRLPHRGQPPRLTDRAVHVQGDRRADGRAGGPDRAGRHAPGARLGRRAAAAAAVRRGEGPGVLDGQAARRRSVGRARACSRPARSSACTRTRGSRSRRRSWAPRSCRPRPGEAGALALLSIADRDKALLPRLAAGLAAAGYRLAATPGTRRALAEAGYEARPVAKLGEARRRRHRRGPDPRPHRAAARSGSSSTRRRRAPGRSATRPRSASPRPGRGSCA